MPYSAPFGKGWTRQTILSLSPRPQRILDVGAGAGTYSDLLREEPGGFWAAIEIWEPYIEQFNLNDKYDVIYNLDARTCLDSIYTEFDIVFMGDVLEHMTKEEAYYLVQKVMDNSRWALVSIPIEDYPQHAEEGGNPYEEHIKDDWSHEEVVATFGPLIRDHHIEEEIGCYLLSAKDARLKKDKPKLVKKPQRNTYVRKC